MLDSGKKRTLLIAVADNSVTNNEQLINIFSEEFNLIKAKTGIEVLDLLRSMPEICTVIIDICIPEMNGFSVIETIHQDEQLRAVPIIVDMNDSDTDSQVRALDYGAADILVKPLDPQIILHRVRNIIMRKEAAEQIMRKSMVEQLLYQSEIDEKTGIFNKHAFCRRTRQLLNDNPEKEYVLFRWDIDRFKIFNDAFGVASGDEFLAKIGTLYRNSATPSITYGHWEADHFVTCMEYQKFIDLDIEKIFPKSAVDLHPDFDYVPRMGVYIINDRSLDVALMCDRALLALRSIKDNFEKQVTYYDESMREALIEELEIVGEMRNALAQGQFIIYLQPQYDYAQKKLHGAEALIRWKHPQKGMILPGKFIPIFERNGFITKIDEYVWEQVCVLQKKWIDQGLPVVPISVNISRRDIYNPRLCNIIIDLVRKYDLDPSLIRLEITESTYMENPEHIIKTVETLRSAGFSVEMDDFGSGYSSLNMLKDITVDMLKLDMKFLDSSIDNARSGNILTSIIRMAHWIKLPVIAEGVETLEQAEYLKSVGCHYMQGFYFAQPITITDFEEILFTKEPEKTTSKLFSNDIVGAENFLSASTQAALLFNSFVGGAVILEYDDNSKNVEALRLNDKYFEVLGITREEYAGKQLNILERFDEKNKDVLVCAIRKTIETGQETGGEICSKPFHTGSEPIWTQFRMRFLAKNEDRYILYAAIENITNRVMLMKSNAQLSEHLTSIIDSVPGGIFDFEITQDRVTITYFNDMAASMAGYSREDFKCLYAETPLDIIHPDDLAEVRSKIGKINEGADRLHETVYRHKCANGEWRWVRLTGRVVRYQNGTLLARGILMDIDSQIRNERIAAKQAEELEHQRISLETLYNTIPCGIMQFSSTVGNCDMTGLIGFNNTAWKLFGYVSREQYLEAVRGISKLKDVYSEDIAIVQSTIAKISESAPGEIAECDHRILRIDGVIRWVHIVFQKIQYAHNNEVIQIVFYDITERKQENLMHISKALFSVYDEVYEFDPEHNISILRATNRRSSIQTGITVPFDKQLEKLCTQIVYEEDRDAVRTFFSVKTGGPNFQPRTIEYRYKATDGTLHWTSCTLLYITDSSFLACNRNITDQKNAQNLAEQNYMLQTLIKERQKEDERNRIFIETTGMIVCDYDPDSDTMKMQCKSPEGTVTESTTEHYVGGMLENPHISVEDREHIRNIYLEIIKNPNRITIEFRSDEFGDSFRLCRAQMVSIADKNGKVYRIIGQILEVHDELQNRLYNKLHEITGYRYDNISFHSAVIDEALRILESAADSHSAIKSVLASVGKQFNVSRVFIVEENSDGIHCSNIFEWCNEGITPEIDNLQNYEYPDGVRGKYIELFDEDGLFVCSDVSVLSSWMRDELERQGVKATVQCAIIDDGIFHGYVGFDECTHNRIWTDMQIHTLQMIARLVSSFLFASRNKTLLDLSDDIIQVIQSSPGYVYMIDPDTCEILYYNESIQSLTHTPLLGERCYKAFMKLDKMCDICPLKVLHQTSIPVPTLVIRNGKRFVMQASTFLRHGKKVILISGTDAGNFKQNRLDKYPAHYEENLNKHIRTLFNLYDEIFEFDFNSNTLKKLFSKYSSVNDEQKKLNLKDSVKEWFSYLSNETDKKLITDFMNLRNIRKSFRQGEAPSISYSVSMPDGTERCYSSILLEMNTGIYLCCNKDITKQKKAELIEKELLTLKSLSETQECYRIVVEQTGTAVVEMNFETGQFSCSDSYYKYETSRHSQADMFKNSGDRALVHPDDQSILETFFAESVSGKSYMEAVLRIKMTDGSFRWTRMVGTYIRDQNGKLLRSIGTFTDIDEEMRAKKELQTISKRLQQIITNIPTGVAIYEFGTQAYPVFVSDKTCEILGFTREEYDLLIANGEPVHYMPPQSDLAPYVTEKIQYGKPMIIPKIQAKKKDGSLIWLRIYYSIDKTPEDKLYCYAVLVDITDELERERQAVWQAERYKLLSESVGVITFDYAPQTDIMNVFITTQTKGLVEEKHTNYMKKFSSYKRISQHCKNGFITTLQTASEKPCSGAYDFQADYFNGIRWYQAKYISVADDNGQVYRVVGRVDDINDIMLAQSEMRTNIQIDEVTGIRGKDSARFIIEKALKERLPSITDALIFIDIDNFKQINDTIGHFEADKILHKVAETLQDIFRKQDIIARFGGDEFIVYMQSAGNIKNVEEKAKHVNSILNKIVFDKDVAVHCSIGIREISGELRDFETVFKHADKALYDSKYKGKNTYTVFKEQS